jgi:hypothetical protein
LSRSRIAYCTTRLGAVLAAALLGLLAACLGFPGEAMAATLPPAVSAQLAGPQFIHPLLAAATPTVKTVTAIYTCDFSAYAASGSTIPTATVSVTAGVATPWPVNQPDDIALANDAIALPATVTNLLAGVDSIVVASQVTAKHATKASITLAGFAHIDAGSAPTEIPSITTVGQVTFAAKGTNGSVALPAQSITFTPMAGNTPQPHIVCTAPTSPPQDVKITVGNASGSFYHCTTTVAGQSPDVSAGPAPLTISETGTKKTGDSLTIGITSSDVASLISTAGSLVTAAGGTLDNAAFSADLAVTGAQSGTVHITKTVTDLTATAFSASAKLKLTKKGTVKINLPSKFGVALSASGAVVVDIACTLVTHPAPVALTLTVAQGPAPTPSPTASATGTNGETDDTGAAVDATGTPAGGAATGGGVTPGSDMPLAFGGIGMLLVGGGLIVSRWRIRASSAARRRRSLAGASPSADSAPDGSSSDSPGGPAA